MVLDFANEADDIKAAFEPYYETTLLSEATDPNLLYEIQTRLEAFPVHAQSDVNAFAKVYFDPKVKQDRLYAVLAPVVQRFTELPEDERQGFRGQLTDYVRLHAFLAQVLTFADADLEKLYVFARHLRRLLPADRKELPIEVQQNIDMESYRIRETRSGRVALDRKAGVLDPVGSNHPRASGAKRAWGSRGDVHRPQDADRRGEGRVRGELPEESRAGVPGLEGGRIGGERRLLRTQRSGDREALGR